MSNGVLITLIICGTVLLIFTALCIFALISERNKRKKIKDISEALVGSLKDFTEDE